MLFKSKYIWTLGNEYVPQHKSFSNAYQPMKIRIFFLSSAVLLLLTINACSVKKGGKGCNCPSFGKTEKKHFNLN